MIIISKITYCGEQRIKLVFDFNFKTKNLIKSLSSAKYSHSLNAWHIAYDKKEYNELLKLNLDLKTKAQFEKDNNKLKPYLKDKSDNNKKTVLKLSESQQLESKKDIIEHLISIEFHSPKFHIKINYNLDIISFIKNLKSSYWSKHLKVWIVKANIENLNNLQDKFNYWDENEFKKISDIINLLTDPKKIEIYRTPDNPTSIWIKLSGFKVDIDFLKHLDKSKYDKRFKRWSIPNKDYIIKRITEHYKNNGTKVINRLPMNDSIYEKQHITFHDRQSKLILKADENFRETVKEYTDVLIAQRYSWNTIQLYNSALIRFQKYHGSLKDASSNDINKYIAEIASQNISDSSINIVINAIKFYFTKVIFKPDFEIEKIKRPRKSRRFPSILSKQEVERILRSLNNLKHITVLFTLYSSGMRLGEILNLKVNDINFDRNQIFIRAGKGKKDRIVMLSNTLKEMLIIYSDHYKPIYWLFESQDKMKQYSESSVRNIVKSATRKAKITKRVTPHTLRHCFATHLMDSGTQISYIQELLGHKDIKTTLLYTHLTTRNTTSIQSPLDNLDFNF